MQCTLQVDIPNRGVESITIDLSLDGLRELRESLRGTTSREYYLAALDHTELELFQRIQSLISLQQGDNRISKIALRSATRPDKSAISR